MSRFEGGEMFRSGCTFHRGQGKLLYFRPGHATYPTYCNEQVRRVILNAVFRAASASRPVPTYGNYKPVQPIGSKA